MKQFLTYQTNIRNWQMPVVAICAAPDYRGNGKGMLNTVL